MNYDHAVYFTSFAALVVAIWVFLSGVPMRWTWRDLWHATRVALWAFKNYAQLCGLKATLSSPATYDPFPATVHAQTVRHIVDIYMQDFPDAP